MTWVILWIIMGIAVAIIAAAKGRNAGLWFLYGVAIWPIALVHILVKPRTPAADRARAAEEGRRPCPFCAELIRAEAKLCPHCRSTLEPGWAHATAPAPAPAPKAPPLMSDAEYQSERAHARVVADRYRSDGRL